MPKFLKKLESENFRLRYLKLSEIDSWNYLENYTRIKSFILDEEFEIAECKWYKMYVSIVELLQTVNPINSYILLKADPFTGRSRPFLDHFESGYSQTSFGLYLRQPVAASNIVYAIKKMVSLYGFDPENAYLVVELTPDAANDYSNDVIEDEKRELYEFLKRTFVDAEMFYDIAITAIDEMNNALKYYSKTTYNNLYLLGHLDYDKYSKEAIEKQLSREDNTFTRRELTLSVEWLWYSRFQSSNYYKPEYKISNNSYIVDGEKRIMVMFETYFFYE